MNISLFLVLSPAIVASNAERSTMKESKAKQKRKIKPKQDRKQQKGLNYKQQKEHLIFIKFPKTSSHRFLSSFNSRRRSPFALPFQLIMTWNALMVNVVHAGHQNVNRPCRAGTSVSVGLDCVRVWNWTGRRSDSRLWKAENVCQFDSKINGDENNHIHIWRRRFVPQTAPHCVMKP